VGTWSCATAMLRAAVFLLSGCAALRNLPPETRAEEITWQSLHGVDALQTFSIARDPECFQEITDPVIGHHPSEVSVLLWAAGASVLHFLVTDYLAEHTSPTVVRLWEGITIGSTGYFVWHNHQIGIRVFGPNEPPTGKCGEP
jgi:hypothetical protein